MAVSKLADARKGRLQRVALSIGTSALAIGCATPVAAQVAMVRSVRNITAQVVAQATGVTTTLVRSPTMQQALTNQASHQAQIAATRTILLAAQNAAIAATRANPSDGLSASGLDPIQAIKAAITMAAAGDSAGSAASLASARAAVDDTGNGAGKATWEGAGLPGQTTDTAGNVTVTIDQTQARALLSWNKFDIGAKTTLAFNQSLGGVAQPTWTVVNRVIDSIAPSTILGKITAPGTVFVLNTQGVIFGAHSQVNTQSLLVSTLELGSGLSSDTSLPNPVETLATRNNAYLQNGLFATAAGGEVILAPDYTQALVPIKSYTADTAYNLVHYTTIPGGVEGSVILDAGAQITAGTGGYIIVAAPSIDSSGYLSAFQGQVSLQAGRIISATASTGAGNSADPNVRGFLLRSFLPGRDDPAGLPTSTLPDDGIVINRGLIQSGQGYLSLGAGLRGSVENDGLLSATTSVSRNGKIDLSGGSVTFGSESVTNAAGVVATVYGSASITADEDGETIPQGDANNPPGFKSSQIVIGDYGRAISADLMGMLTPGQFTLGANALIYAPNADVVVGRAAGTVDPLTSNLASGVDILDGATIDVSGLKNVQLAASINSVAVTPVKRNELRDTPNYREVAIGDNFTLNGTTLYIDPRVSGVRADGVAWVGSPLIEAASIVSQLPVTASELMTKGGTVALAVNGLTRPTDAASAPHIAVAKTATIDISGGWVNYAAGVVQVSNLISADGRLVDIGQADPNGDYIGVANGYSQSIPSFGVTSTFTNTLQEGSQEQASYDEGRDAGALVITGPAIDFSGTIAGQAFAGARQLTQALQPRGSSAFGAGTRVAQASKYQLPVGGAVQIGSFTGALVNYTADDTRTGAQAGLGADIVVYAGTRSDAPSYVQTLLSADMLSTAGIADLTLQTSGAVTFTGGGETLLDPTAVALNGASNLALAAGGMLKVQAGRSITFNGTITVPAGSVSAQTLYLATPILTRATDNYAIVGSPFTNADDVLPDYASLAAARPLFDVDVNGTISTSGRFSNDLLVTDGLYNGPAWQNGGSISLTVAPNVFAAVSGDGGRTVSDYADLSGSINIASQALLDVSAGAYVSTTGAVTASAKGGSIGLTDATLYAQLDAGYPSIEVGTNFTLPQIFSVPSQQLSHVSFAENSLKAFSFSGSGSFSLVSPLISFGSDTAPNSSHISLAFLQNTGFGALHLTSLQSVVAPGLFSGSGPANVAFLTTADYTIKSGETFNLTQSLLPDLLSVAQLDDLRLLPSGGTLTSVLTPAIPINAWDQLAAGLTISGLGEFDVEAGGTLTGAAQASVTVPMLYNAGSIILHGGAITQQETLPNLILQNGVALSPGTSLSTIFGTANGNGAYDPNAGSGLDFSFAGIRYPYSNYELATRGAVYFLGQHLASGQGMVLAAGSVTDLSGAIVINPYAPIMRDGTRVVTGRLIAGGSLATAAGELLSSDYFATPTFTATPVAQYTSQINVTDFNTATIPGTLTASPGATLNISGASGTFDIATSATSYAATPEWSDAGTLSALGGGTIAGATILATGGAPAATGGTLEWLDPTLTDHLTGADTNRLLTSQIQTAGFDTLIARGGLSFDGGDVALTLRKALFVASAPLVDPTSTLPATAPSAVMISATADTRATIDAGYIQLASLVGRAAGGNTLAGATGNANVTFNAGSLGMDVFGAVLFNGTIANTMLYSAADLRLTGVNTAPLINTPVLNGELVTQGNLTIDAARTYTTTGTGNLQQILENFHAGTMLNTSALPFEIDAFGNSTISFLGTHANAITPLSAGSYLRVQAQTIVQDGYLAAPLGILELGGNGTASIAGQSAFTNSVGVAPRAIDTLSLTFGAGSTTTVSGAGVTIGGVATKIPYGTTTDLSQYYFTPTVTNPITSPPTGEFILSGGAITVATGAKLDGHGGGDVFAYEFISGTGGSRDVLSRFNTDQYSADKYNAATGSGLQYADGRQVFAIVPADQASKIATYDPIYSADYTASGPVDLYGAAVGETVHLDGGDGIAAGDYVLLPAHYALLPGAYRIVENTGSVVPYAGTSSVLRDGSIVMGGTFGTAGVGLSGSTRYSFTIQPQATVLAAADLVQTGATTALQAQAVKAGTIVPQLPIDAARVILSPLTSLRIDGALDLTPAAGGFGAKIDIGGSDIVIGATDPGIAGAVFLANATLANLDANSLFIGGQRQDNADGTTTLNISASKITVDGDAVVSAPELLFAVGAIDTGSADQPTLAIADGASLAATGALSDTRSGDYIIPSNAIPPMGDPYALTGIGAALRVATGPERLFQRQGDFALRNTLKAANLKIGAATLTGTDIALDSSRNFVIADAAVFAAPNIALSGDNIAFGTAGIKPSIEAKLAAASLLTLRSPGAIRFSSGTYAFQNLTLDTPGIARLAVSPTAQAAVANLTITANAFQWYDSAKSFGGCTLAAAMACGTAGSALTIAATTISLGSGAIGVYGFNDAATVNLSATNGFYVAGTGSLAIGNIAGSAAATDSALAITAPFIIDSSTVVNPLDQVVKVDYGFDTRGAFSLVAPTLAAPTLANGVTQAKPTGNRAPGATITIGSVAAPVASANIDGAAIIATAGSLNIQSLGDITLANAASLQVPGYTRTFGDNVDSTTVSAGAGTLTLTSLTGNIVLPATASLVTDTGVGNAGALNLLASEGAIIFAATLNPGVTGSRAGSLVFDAQKSAFDLAAFTSRYGNLFAGDLDIRAGLGNLTLNAGQTIKANSVTLTADDTAAGAGLITIAGTIDTSGPSVAGLTLAAAQNSDVNGGNIALYGNEGVMLASTALLDTHTTGYLDSDTRQASAGNVTLGIANQTAALTIAAGATIDVGARRPSGQTDNRLVAQTVIDPASLTKTTVYHFVQADQGGTVLLRAPVDAATSSHVNIVLPATLPITGAASIQIEGFKSYDLDALAKEKNIVGVSTAPDGVALNLTRKSFSDKVFGNVLADYFAIPGGTGGTELESIPYFIQNFAITAANGTSFDPAIGLRPGVELNSARSITLASNWNLGAGTIDYAKAVANGDAYTYKLGNASYYAVVPGREASLLRNDTQMIYRVGTGDGNIANAAPIVTLRAAKTLTADYSITDGFFTFRDVTDPVYMDYALGGGNRQVLPAATLTCGGAAVQNCSGLVNFADQAASFGKAGNANGASIASINLANIVAGSDVTAFTAPLSQRANSAGALPGRSASGGQSYGDPIGAAEVFPLLDDGTSVASSSSLRLIGGAGAVISADPLHIDRGSGGDVIIAGEHSYTIVTSAGKDTFTTNPQTGTAQLELRSNFPTGFGSPLSAAADLSFIDNPAVDSGLGLSADNGPEVYTVLNWGPSTDALARYLQTKAAAYFDYVNSSSYDFTTYSQLTSAQRDALKVGVLQGPAQHPVGVAARLNDILGFLASIDPTNGKTIGQNIATDVLTHKFAVAAPVVPPPASLRLQTTAYYGSLVRTGNGTIDIAGAGDVKLLRTDNVVYRGDSASGNAHGSQGKLEVGGTAVYTVGHIATAAPVSASTADGKVAINITFAQTANDPSFLSGAYIPSELEQFLQQPELLTGGGSITLTAGNNVFGRPDYFAQEYRAQGNTYFYRQIANDSLGGVGNLAARIGSSDQLWRSGNIGQDTLVGINPALFTTGVGALGGGNIAVKAGGAVSDLTVALDTSLVTANATSSFDPASNDRFATVAATDAGTGLATAPVLATLGGGDLSLRAETNLIGGLIDVASGYASLQVGGNITPSTIPTYVRGVQLPPVDALRLRVADADINAMVNGSVAMTGINALGTGPAAFAVNSAGFFSPIAGLNLVAEGSITFAGDFESAGILPTTDSNGSNIILPGTLNLAALSDDITLADPSVEAKSYLLYPSAAGQLSLLSGGSISNVSIAMLDNDPSLLPGVFSAYMGSGVPGVAPTANNLGFEYPVISPTTPDGVLRLYHDSAILHAGDPVPVRIYVAGSLTDANILVAKQARISAGKDILNLYFAGQNVSATDTTRITAGRDIAGSVQTAAISNAAAGTNPFKQYVAGNSFTLGGPGTLDIEAGRDLGPFISSGVVSGISYAGGIRTVGNDYDPWLPSTGADLTVAFGIAGGADYAGLRETYLDPANSAKLDGALFVQIADAFGNEHPDRTQPIYAPVLAQWLAVNEPQAFTSVFGAAPSDLSGTALTTASYARYGDLYTAFAQLNQIDQNRFLINTLYFKELAAAADVTSASYHQYIRGYRAVQTLFPTSLGYTDNLATYTTDPATVSVEHPLGVPVRNLVNGQPEVATRVLTGNADLRLSTIETDRGGNITILGPGGDFIDGSVVRTSAEIAGNATTAAAPPGNTGLDTGQLPIRTAPSAFTAIPQGFEGVLTLRGGAIDDFTDGNFEVNQSRVFTQAGGDITMWSSNGDLNAGQGPKSASNFPPITVDFTPDGNSEVNSAGSVSGAGIGAFQAAPTDPLASIYLLAPAGEVDAGDAGVRASGNVVVAAARVANADNFKAGGTISGVPTSTTTAVVTPAAANSALVANVARITGSNQLTDDKTIITVEVTDLGCSNDDKDKDKVRRPNSKDDKTC